jgi:5-hydroxyisourate hydrolase
MAITANVIDCLHGRPAAGLAVHLKRRGDTGWDECASGSTGQDGTVAGWTPPPPDRPNRGLYQLIFDSGSYYAVLGVASFHSRVTIEFIVADSNIDFHVPLLLGPYAYTTFRSDQ